MRRIFWVGVGVTVTVLVIRKGQQLRARYSPPAIVDRTIEGLGERADDFGSRLVAAGRGFAGDFAAAMAQREEQLRAALLSDGQEQPDDVRARRAGRHSEYAGGASRLDTVDEDDDGDLPYSF